MIFANEQTVIFGDPIILHDEQYSYIGDPMISANERVKMWGSKVFISYSNIIRVEMSHPSQSSLTRFFRFFFFVVIIWVGLKEKLNFVM